MVSVDVGTYIVSRQELPLATVERVKRRTSEGKILEKIDHSRFYSEVTIEVILLRPSAW